MSKLFTFLRFVLIFSRAWSTPILEKPVIDTRVEVLSIAFRLAECDEYSSQYNKVYVERIEKHFEKYRDHELIQYIEKFANMVLATTL